MRTLLPWNPRPKQAIPLLPASIIALLIGLLVAYHAHSQTNEDPSHQSDRPAETDSSGTSKSDGTKTGDDSRDANSDHNPLKDHKNTINRLLGNRNYGRAMQNAFAMRRKLDGTEWSEASADYYFSVQDRIEKAFEQVKDRTDELVKRNQPYRAYRYLKTELPHFDNCAPYERRLKRKHSSLKVDVIQAYNNGELDTKPAFIPDRGSDRSTNDSSQKDPDEETSTKQKDKKGNPRIYAKAPSMSNAPGSPKAFEPSVVETTKNSVHFKVDFQGTDNRQKMGYFLFELRGLGGREKVRIDLVNMGRWENSKAITPLYSRGVDELSDLNSLRARPPRNGKLEYVKTPHGQKVPKTETLQKWHYFKNVSRKDDQQTLVVRKRFPEEMTHTFFCHRIPYSYAYYLEHMDQLEERAKYGDGRLTVHNVGETGKGNPIHIVELENPTDPQAKNKPVVLLTAGEHPDEHDTYHAMRGVIEFLLKNTEAAENLRRKATFLVIPVLDPDGLAELRYVNICQSFADKSNFASYADPPSKTSVAIAQWIRGWINNGRRLSAQILIHNVEGGETNSHLFSYLVESKSGRHTLSKSFWHHVRKHVKSIGFRTEKKPKKSGYLAARLGGFLNANFGTFNLFVELNSQADYPGAKLTLKQIQDIGKILVAATVNWLYNNDKAVKSIEKKRRKRRRLYEKYSVIEKNRRVVQAENPFDMESWLWVLPEYEETYFSFDREMRDKLWISRAMKLIYPDSVDEKNESFSE